MLGYPTHATFVTEILMAKNPTNINKVPNPTSKTLTYGTKEI